MGEFSGRPTDKPIDLVEVFGKDPILEGVFAEFGKFVMDMGKLTVFTKNMNTFVKKEADKVKKQKGKISKEEYQNQMVIIVGKVADKLSKSDLSPHIKAAFMDGVLKKLEKELGKPIKEEKLNEADERETMINFLQDLGKLLSKHKIRAHFDDGSLFMDIGKYSVGFNDDDGFPFDKRTIDKFVKDIKKKK